MPSYKYHGLRMPTFNGVEVLGTSHITQVAKKPLNVVIPSKPTSMPTGNGAVYYSEGFEHFEVMEATGVRQLNIKIDDNSKQVCVEVNTIIILVCGFYVFSNHQPDSIKLVIIGHH